MTHSDQYLMARLRDGDEKAFEWLLARYRDAVLRHLVTTVRDRAAADDLHQEVFLRLWTRAEQWDGRGALKAWLFRIATNLALNHLRTVQRRREQPLEIMSDAAVDDRACPVPGWIVDTASPGPEAALEQAERQALLHRLINALPEQQRAVFHLVHEEEMPLQEVAEALGIPEGTVKSRLHYARKRLALAWQEMETLWQGLL
jgi:RNA polymerase sigma-70 factor, ECF subfamily